MKKLSTTLVFLFSFGFLFAQCTLTDDYTNSNLWIQVGTNVEVSNGKMNFLNGAAGGQQRRVYRSLGTVLDSNDTWSFNLTFRPTSVNNWGGPATGHTLFAITAGNQDPYNDCPNIPCSGFPIGNQDGIIFQYQTTNPTQVATHIPNTIFFNIAARDGGNEYRGLNILTGTQMNTNYYISGERFAIDSVRMSVFSDSARTIHIPNSPITLAIPSTITGLNTLQHGNVARGDSRRQLTGTIDNLCLNYSTISTSIHSIENSVQNELQVFPNPAQGTVRINGNISKNPGIRVFDRTGKLVLFQNSTSFSVERLPAGIYYVQVQEPNRTLTKKLVVQ